MYWIVCGMAIAAGVFFVVCLLGILVNLHTAHRGDWEARTYVTAWSGAAGGTFLVLSVLASALAIIEAMHAGTGSNNPATDLQPPPVRRRV